MSHPRKTDLRDTGQGIEGFVLDLHGHSCSLVPLEEQNCIILQLTLDTLLKSMFKATTGLNATLSGKGLVQFDT